MRARKLLAGLTLVIGVSMVFALAAHSADAVIVAVDATGTHVVQPKKEIWSVRHPKYFHLYMVGRHWCVRALPFLQAAAAVKILI